MTMRLLMAAGGGVWVAMLARRGKPVGSIDTLTLTLILMSILIAMATQIIGNNIARAFSLVGALSIVRFRTAVPATRDVAFVLAAVVEGMAVGAGQYPVAVVGLIVVTIATVGFVRPDVRRSTTPPWRISLQVGLGQVDSFEDAIEPLVESVDLISVETVRRGTATELIYRVSPRQGTTKIDLMAKLETHSSVESVSIRPLNSS